MTTFHLEILSPERTFYNGDCISLVVPISDGMLGVQANHTPLTAAISDGEAVFTSRVFPTKREHFCRIQGDTFNRMWIMKPAVRDHFLI